MSTRGDGPITFEGVNYTAQEMREGVKHVDETFGPESNYHRIIFTRLGFIVAALAGAGWAVVALAEV